MAAIPTPKVHLLVVLGKDAARTPYWETKWRTRNGRQVKRRLGPAFLERRPNAIGNLEDGATLLEGWRQKWSEPLTPTGRPRRAPEGSGLLTFSDATSLTRELVEQYEREQNEAAERAVREPEGPVLFGAVADQWLSEREADVADEHLKKSTLVDYRSMLREADAKVRARGRKPTAWLRREFDDLPVSGIGADQIDRFERKLRDAGLSARTRTKYLAVLSMILDFAVARKAIDANPMAARPRAKKGRQRKPRVRVYAWDVIEQIAEAADLPVVGSMIRTAALTGLRQGELLALRWSNIDFTARSITVAMTYGGADIAEDLPKSGAARTVPLSDQAAAVLDRVSRREHFTRGGDLVFCTKLGHHIDGSTIRREYNHARDRVIARAAKISEELPKLPFHDLRHAFGSTCAAAGVPLATIKVWMGHANISTTEIYVHWMPQHDDAERLTRAQAVGSPGEVSELRTRSGMPPFST